ncbi:MAG: hypothetical protein IJN52_11425, partial [Bacteroidales bacterium]|nr:hypothetical protein [Bacteroidales bacterium]
TLPITGTIAPDGSLVLEVNYKASIIITRVYRGPNCEYKGWQKNSITTPDLLFEVFSQPSENPFWTKYLEPCTENEILVNCTPEESREILIAQVERFYPGTRSKLEKLF